MLRFLIYISIFHVFVFGQATFTPSKDEQTKVYCQVITEYIKAVTKTDKLHFDTLFLGNHPDFPKIKLPDIIQSKTIILLTEDESYKKKDNKSYVLINIAEQKFTKDQAEFILVTFHKGNRPQHNCYIDLKYNSTKKNYELDKKIRF